MRAGVLLLLQRNYPIPVGYNPDPASRYVSGTADIMHILYISVPCITFSYFDIFVFVWCYSLLVPKYFQCTNVQRAPIALPLRHLSYGTRCRQRSGILPRIPNSAVSKNAITTKESLKRIQSLTRSNFTYSKEPLA